MPMALPLVGAAFMAAGSIMTAVGVTAAIAGISLATIATVAGVALMAVSMLTMQVPKPHSSGTQLDTKMSAKAPVPVIYGHTATGGTLVYRELAGKKNALLYMAIALSAAGPIGGVEYAYANDVALNFAANPSTTMSMVTSTTPTSKKLYQGHLGMRFLRGDAPATTTISQGFGSRGPAPKNPGLASGHAMALVFADYDSDQFPQGLPKMLWTVFGVKVYDPRRDSTYPGGSGPQRLDNAATWEWSDNPYLCALHWTLGKFENGRKVVGIGAHPSEVDFPAFVRGANVADANGWRCGGMASTSDDKFSVLSTILASGGGVPIARGAQISCHVNSPLTTTATITAADIVRDVEIQNSSSLRSRYNTVIPTYREPSQFWEIISGEQVTSPVYVDEDGGFQTSKEVEFTMVQQAAQAHQLATYNLVNSREMLTFTVGVKLRGLSFRVGDAVVVNVPQIAATAIKCLVINREYNPADQVVTLTLKSENDAKHAFALGQSQVAPPTISLTGYDASDMAAPEATSWLVNGGTLASDTGIKPIIRVQGANDNPYTATIIVEYRPVGSAQWFDAGVYSRDTTSIEITAVTANTAYEVAVSYRSITGALSDRSIYGPVIAGDESYAWSAVAGGGKPQDNATVGAPGNTPVGTSTGNQVVADISAAHAAIGTINILTDAIQGQIDALVETYGNTASALASAHAAALASTNAEAARANADAARQQAEAAQAAAAIILSDTGTERATAVIARIGAQTAAAEAAGYRDQSSASATTAAGSASSASESASLSAQARDSAAQAAVASATSKDQASASATAAGLSATASHDSYLAASTAQGEAQHAASAAAQSASNAAASENAAGQSAAASQADRIAAQTARSDAESYRNQAVTSSQSAEGSASTASTQAGLAATARQGAQDAAGAANTAAATASAKASEAGQSAAAAQTAQVSASASALAAKDHADAASASYTNAEIKAGEAGIYASAASGHANTAGIRAGNAEAAALTANGAAAVATDKASQAAASAILSASYAADNTAQINDVATAAASATQAVAQRVGTLETTTGGHSARLSTVEQVASSAFGRVSGASWSKTAVAGNGRAQLTVYAYDSNGAVQSGVDIVVDLTVSGNVIVDGTIQTRSISANAITNTYYASNGSYVYGSGLFNYVNSVSYSVPMEYSGQLVVIGGLQITFPASESWRFNLVVNNGAGDYILQSGAGSGDRYVNMSGVYNCSSPGAYWVRIDFAGSSSSVYLNPGAAGLVTLRTYK